MSCECDECKRGRERERVGFSGNGAPPFLFFLFFFFWGGVFWWRLNGIGGYGIL